jgi:hypothetical protein
MPDLPDKPLFDAPDGTNPTQPMEPQMPEAVPTTSPTGTPVIAATGLLLKLATVAVAIAGVALVSDFFPATNLDEKISGAVVSLGALLGIVSPGIRK